MRFLLNMVRVIGRVLGTTHPVGRVVPVQGFQIGGEFSIADSKPQPAKQGSKPKRSRVKAAILAPSPKVETLPVPTRTKKSSTSGTQQATPASQSAKQKPKRKPKTAPSTTRASSRKPAQKSAPKTRGQTGKRKTAA